MKKLGKKMKEQKNTLKAFACSCIGAAECSTVVYASVTSYEYNRQQVSR